MPTSYTSTTSPLSGRTPGTWAGSIYPPALPLGLLVANLMYPQDERSVEASPSPPSTRRAAHLDAHRGCSHRIRRSE
jgi:hypothetical protein